MSVGGRVMEVRDRWPESLTIVTWDERSPWDDCIGVSVKRNENSERIEPGDEVWWQGPKVYWTPADGSRQDVPIPKWSVSFVVHEDGAEGKYHL